MLKQRFKLIIPQTSNKGPNIFFSNQKSAVYLKGLEILAFGWIWGSWWRWNEAAKLKGSQNGETARKMKRETILYICSDQAETMV